MFVDLDALYIDFVNFFFHYYFIHEYFTCILAYFVFLFKGFQRIVPFSVFTRKYNPANKEKKEKKYMIYQPLLALKMECKYLQNKVFTFLSLHHYANKMQIKKNIV
jgi:hypothetical protein